MKISSNSPANAYLNTAQQTSATPAAKAKPAAQQPSSIVSLSPQALALSQGRDENVVSPGPIKGT